jgi:signal transduction histidine kinase
MVGAVGTVRQALDDLASSAQVREFHDLYESAATLAEFAPDLLIFAASPGFEQDLGAVRVLRGLLPDLGVIVVGTKRDLPIPHRDACATHGIVPFDPDSDLVNFAEIVARAIGDDKSDSYLEFVQGICDEINNPLMFASGHLQLLESRLDPEDDRDPLAQVVAIRQGLDRIQGTMRKVGAMGRASTGERQREPFTVDEVISAIEVQIRATKIAAQVACKDDAREIVLNGDLQLVAGALFGLCQVGAELNSEEQDVTLQVRRSGDAIELHMEVRNPRLEEWELPRAFEPYHLNGILRGTTLGLNLFLVRLVTRAHGWDASAQRLSGPRVAFRIGPTKAANGRE